MTIYILDDDPNKCAEYLHDKSLTDMLRDIAQVLCNVHWLQFKKTNKIHEVPLQSKNMVPRINKVNGKINHTHVSEWTKWASESESNYIYLCNLGIELYLESVYRFSINKINMKYKDVIRWCWYNVPNFVENKEFKLPLIIPNKYKKVYSYNEGSIVIQFNRKYFNEIIGNLEEYKLKWTKRKKPEWLKVSEYFLCCEE